MGDTSSSPPTLAIVAPCFNEEAMLPEAVRRLLSVLDALHTRGKITAVSYLCLVDDGSHDRTWALIEQHAAADDRVRGIKLSRNRGHQNALLAGLLTVTGDAVVSIDVDLQDDLDVLEDMVDALGEGKDVVFGVRTERAVDTLLNRLLAEGYYTLMRWLGVDIVFNHADYRLMSRRALNALKEYGEVNLFLRGLIPTIGFPTAVVRYARQERAAGESKYPLRKLISLALHGLTSFSAVPLRMIALAGGVIFLVTIGLSGWVLWLRFVADAVVPAWAATVLPMYFLGSIQLLGLGVVGEYVAKTYMETKRRPRFIIEKTLRIQTGPTGSSTGGTQNDG